MTRATRLTVFAITAVVATAAFASASCICSDIPVPVRYSMLATETPPALTRAFAGVVILVVPGPLP